MRFPVVVLLAASALFSSVRSTSTGMSTPSTIATTNAFTAVHYDAPTKRMLRSERDDEERAITEKITGWINAGAAKIKMRSDLKAWLKNGDSVDDVLAKLKLHTGVGNILENPTFKNLQKYIAMYNKKFPDSGVTMVGTLTARYGDEAVARALEAGKWSENMVTNALARKLQGEQFRLWLKEEQSPLAIFRLLRLHEQAKHPLAGYTIEAWRSYLDVFNKRLLLRQASKIDELSVFREAYGDRGLATMLLRANGSREVRSRANFLQRAQFKDWSEKGVHPEDVFTKLYKVDRISSDDNMVVDAYIKWLASEAKK